MILASFVVLLTITASEASEKPHIIFFLADDLGKDSIFQNGLGGTPRSELSKQGGIFMKNTLQINTTRLRWNSSHSS